jgi:hypothetical protein
LSEVAIGGTRRSPLLTPDTGGFLAVATLALAVYWLAARGVHVHEGGDTTAYEAVARDQLSWGTIFSTQRPPLYPALFQLCGFSRTAVAALQTAVSLVAWLLLAAAIWRRRVLLAALTMYVALYPGFAAWNHVLMTESLEISLTVVAFVCLLRFLDGAPAAFWGFIAVMVFKCTLRGFDTFIDLVWLPAIAGFAAIFLGCFVYFNAATGTRADDVWYFALLDNIGIRVLPDPRWLQFFAAHGMPVNDALRAMAGKWAYEDNWRFWTAPDLAGFRHWLTVHGRGAMSAFLMQHPAVTLGLFWRHLGEVFQGGSFRLGDYFDPAYALVLPPWPPFGAVYAADTAGIALLLLAIVTGVAPRVLLVPSLTAAALWASTVPIGLSAYWGDPMAIDRHALPVQLQAALCLLLLGRTAADWRALARKQAFFEKKDQKTFAS